MTPSHYIHRPTPPGGETDPRFRELTGDIVAKEQPKLWAKNFWWHAGNPNVVLCTGTIWRIPGSDAPSAELLKLAEETRNG